MSGLGPFLPPPGKKFPSYRATKDLITTLHFIRGMIKKVAMVSLLAALRAGKYPAQIAKEMGVSHQAINKKIAELRRKGLILRIKGYPAQYRVLAIEEQQLQPTTTGGDDSNQKSEFVPHNFGETWAVLSGDFKAATGPWKQHYLARNKLAIRRSKTPLFTVVGVLGATPKLTIWLKRGEGKTPAAIVASGRLLMREWLKEFAGRFGLKLEFVRYAGQGAIEWATREPGGDVGRVLIDGLALREGPVKVGDTVFKANDKSHPGSVEVVSASPGVRPAEATKVVQRFTVLTKDDAFMALPSRMEKLEAALLKFGDGLNMLIEEKLVSDAIKPRKNEDRKEVG